MTKSHLLALCVCLGILSAGPAMAQATLPTSLLETQILTLQQQIAVLNASDTNRFSTLIAQYNTLQAQLASSKINDLVLAAQMNQQMSAIYARLNTIYAQAQQADVLAVQATAAATQANARSNSAQGSALVANAESVVALSQVQQLRQTDQLEQAQIQQLQQANQAEASVVDGCLTGSVLYRGAKESIACNNNLLLASDGNIVTRDVINKSGHFISGSPTGGLVLDAGPGNTWPAGIIFRSDNVLGDKGDGFGNASNAGYHDLMYVRSDGNVGIGTNEPKTKLDVNGEVKVGSTNAVCTAANAGAIRFVSGAFQGCDGNAWRGLAYTN